MLFIKYFRLAIKLIFAVGTVNWHEKQWVDIAKWGPTCCAHCLKLHAPTWTNQVTKRTLAWPHPYAMRMHAQTNTDILSGPRSFARRLCTPPHRFACNVSEWRSEISKMFNVRGQRFTLWTRSSTLFLLVISLSVPIRTMNSAMGYFTLGRRVRQTIGISQTMCAK